MNFRIGDLVRIVEDPSSFFVKDDDIGQVGIVIEYNEFTEVYVVLILGSEKVVKTLSFMLEAVV